MKTNGFNGWCLTAWIALTLSGCGGGNSASSVAPPPVTDTPPTNPIPISPPPATSPPSTINTQIGKPPRLLAGLGAGNSISEMNRQSIHPDIIDTYLVGVGAGAWPTYNSPSGAYVTNVMSADTAQGAIPMFTLYQMAANGDGNLSGINDTGFMTQYWSQVKLMFNTIGAAGKPVLVNLEPDFWGYVQLQAPNGDPTQLPAQVAIEPECAALPNNAAGIAACLLKLGRSHAPLAKIGFPPSFFGETAQSLGNFMVKLGADKADFIVAQTSDRDAGCMEVATPPPECAGRGHGPFYWDELNRTAPTYLQSLSDWSTVKSIVGNLPMLFWQTPMGVPATSAGGTTGHYRDNHVHYMLTNPKQYTSIGVFAIVFSSGADSQTTIATDGGQFATLYAQYLLNPASFP